MHWKKFEQFLIHHRCIQTQKVSSLKQENHGHCNLVSRPLDKDIVFDDNEIQKVHRVLFLPCHPLLIMVTWSLNSVANSRLSLFCANK